MQRNPLRFVVLAHDWPTPHYDLMLARDGVLKTWRLAEEPNPDQAIDAEQIADHRLHYLDYEGPVSGERGHVIRWDSGMFEWILNDMDAFIIELNGKKLMGWYELLRDKENWTFAPVPGN